MDATEWEGGVSLNCSQLRVNPGISVCHTVLAMVQMHIRYLPRDYSKIPIQPQLQFQAAIQVKSLVRGQLNSQEYPDGC